MTTSIPAVRSSRNSTVYDALPNDVYPARITRFIGLGLQDQPDFQGQKKGPAFKCSIQYELISVNATGVKSDGTKIEDLPACVFQDYYLFPGASRGKVFDMCKSIDPSVKETPRVLDWFIENLGAIVMVNVGSYTTREGVVKNTVVGVQPCPSMLKKSVGNARCEYVGFNPYKEDETNLAAYTKMFRYQRDILTEAHDAKNIPFAGKTVEITPASSPVQKETQTAMPDMLLDHDDFDDVPF